MRPMKSFRLPFSQLSQFTICNICIFTFAPDQWFFFAIFASMRRRDRPQSADRCPIRLEHEGDERCAPFLTQVEARRAEARLGGGQKRIDAQHAKGKLTARERLDVLLDEGSFEEYDMYVTHRAADFGMAEPEGRRRRRRHRLGHDQRPPGLCLLPGFHRVRRLAVAKPTRRRSARSWTWRCRNGAPVIGLNDSGGARIQEGVASLAGYADVFRRNARGLAASFRRSRSSWAPAPAARSIRRP